MVRHHIMERYQKTYRPRLLKAQKSDAILEELVRAYFEFSRDNPAMIRIANWALLEGDGEPWEGEDDAHHLYYASIVEAQKRGSIRDSFHDLSGLTALGRSFINKKSERKKVTAMKKEFPHITETYGELFKLPYQALRWEALRTALEMEFFDHFKTPVTAEEIAIKLGLHPKNTEYFCNVLVSMELLVKSKGRFQNTSKTEAFFTTGKDTSLGKALLYMSSWSAPLLNGGMNTRLREGPPPPMDMQDPSVWARAMKETRNFNRCGRAQHMAREVSGLPEFGSFKKMMDMGCGDGMNGVAVAGSHPDVECILFDRPSVCAVAQQTIEEYGMEDRVHTLEGDFTRDSLGEGYDFIMANYCLGMDRDALPHIMEKVCHALTPQGVFMITTSVLTREETAPKDSLLSWLGPLMQGMDFALQPGIMEKEMFRVGFSWVETRTVTNLGAPHGPVVIITGRKKL